MKTSTLPAEKLYFITAFANQADAYLALLDQERQFIDDCFAAYAPRAEVQQRSLPNAGLSDIVETFTEADNRVALFHFAGHAGKRVLNFKDAPANAQGLAAFLRGQGCVPLVFLNGCSTSEQVVFFKEAGVGAVISTMVDIQDSHAVFFAERFYHAFLKQKKTIEESFMAAKNALIMNDQLQFSEADIVIRHFRDPMTARPKSKQKTKKRGVWAMDVFDNNILGLTFNDLGSFINRRRLVKPYSDWLVRQHSRIKMTGLEGAVGIDLEKVFVSLQGGLSKTFEIYQSQKQLDEKIKLLEQQFADNKLSDEEKQRRKAYLLGRVMPTVEERDKRARSGKNTDGFSLNLLEAFLKHDKLVVLGDPGTGKTTLAKWLILMFAKAMREERYIDELRVPLSLFTSADGAGQDGSFQFLRLPILLRVSDFAVALRKEPGLDLEQFLGHQGWLGEYPAYAPDVHGRANQKLDPAALNLLMLDFINKGEALIILDGLDEITDEAERQAVVRNITGFVFKTVDKPARYGRLTNNKLIVTSRIAGYHLNALLHEEMYHLTIQPMDDPAVRNFTHTWMRAAHLQRTAGSKKTFQIGFEAREYALRLCGLIFDPKRPGVRNLAGNPLLLTELGKIYLAEKELPETRIALYEKTAHNMLDIWKERMKGHLPEDMSVYEEKIFFVLEDIAAYIHETYPTGLIRKEQVESQVGKSLEAFYARNPEAIRRQTITAETSAFLKVLSDEVGLLAARASELFGFLHLTFEEFFAARKLLREPNKITQEILSKAYNPRWREPLILAISYLGKQVSEDDERKALLRTLLDAKDTMGNIVPRSASLIALAIPEMNYTPDRHLVRDVLLKLMNAYAQAGASEEGEALRNNVEDTFRALKKNEKVWQEVTSGLVAMLNHPNYSPELKNAVALLIGQLGEYTQLITEALVGARKHDLPDWGWPIHKAVHFVAERRAEWVGFGGLSMREYLFKFPDYADIVRQDEDWLLVFCLLYGSLVAVTNGEAVTYAFSPDGIIFESSLSEKIMDLLEAGAPARSLKEHCLPIWADRHQPLDHRLDAFLMLALFEPGFPSGQLKKELPADHAFFAAAATRISRTVSLLEKPVSVLVKKTLEGLQSVFVNYQDQDVFHLISALFKIDLSYNRTISNPITWISAAPDALKAQFLAEVWVRPFTSDDAPYNLSVTLDTAGAMICRLGLDTIARSLVYVQDVTVLPPYERWRIERSPYFPSAEEDILERALFNLLALTNDFDFFKFWALSILQPLWGKYPSLQEVAKLFLFDVKSQQCGQGILDLLYQTTDRAGKNDPEELEKHVGSSERPLLIVYATQSGILRGTKRLRSAMRPLLETRDAGKLLAELFDVITLVRDHSFFHPEAQDQEFISERLMMAKEVIPLLASPRQRIQAYLKMATFQEAEADQTALVLTCLDITKAIADLFVKSQSLRDILPWTLEHPLIAAAWDRVRAEIGQELYSSIIENRLYPQVKDLPQGSEDHQQVAVTKLGSLLRDLQQLFALPVDTEELWELLRFSPVARMEEIIAKLYKVGIKKRFALTRRGALGVNFLIRNGHRSLVRQLIPCIEFPAHEALPLVRDWLEDSDPDIRVMAALLLLETGILTAVSFQLLSSALFGEVFKLQDQIRNRINLALNGRLFSATQVGIEGLLLIERTITENWDSRPYLVRGVAWLFECLVFDDPDQLQALVKEAGGKGRRAEWAAALIGNIHLTNQKTFKSFLACLSATDTPLILRRRLLRSGVYLLNHRLTSALPAKLWSEFLQVLLTLAGHEDLEISLYAIDTLGFFPDLEERERRTLRKIARQQDAQRSPMALVTLGRNDFKKSGALITTFLRDENPALALAAAEAVARYTIKSNADPVTALASLAEKLGGDEEHLLRAILAATKDRWYGQYVKNCSAVMGAYFDQYPARYLGFLGQIERYLPLLPPVKADSSYANSVRWMERSVHLEAMAAGAERLPSTYYNGMEQIPNIEYFLVAIVLKDGIFTNRMHALTCLSLLREMTRECTLAFCAALKDITEVQTTAVSVIDRFWETSQEFIDHISDLLDSESYSSRYAVINMLTAAGKYNKSDAHIRQGILDILYAKMNQPEFQAPVFLLKKKITVSELSDGTKTESEDGNIIEYKGRLDQQIYKCILEVAGISAVEDQ